jgi:GNAT superfamily N-acetyltransferase
MRAIAIRLATEADREALLALYREFHEFHVGGMPGWLRIPDHRDDREDLEALGQVLRSADAAIFVAEAAGQLVGLAEVYCRQDEPNPATVAYTYGYLQSLVVSAPWRRRGLGRQLVEAAQRWARERGATQMRLSTWEFADGPLHFYESLGYTTVKRTLALNIG